MRLTRDLKYDRADLVKTLKTNRKKHIDNYEAAVIQYNKELIEDLETKLAKARDGVKFNPAVTLPRPEIHVDDYDRAIKMFEMTTEKEVELDQNTFCQLVMDEWNWKSSFLSNTTSYAAKALAAA